MDMINGWRGSAMRLQDLMQRYYGEYEVGFRWPIKSRVKSHRGCNNLDGLDPISISEVHLQEHMVNYSLFEALVLGYEPDRELLVSQRFFHNKKGILETSSGEGKPKQNERRHRQTSFFDPFLAIPTTHYPIPSLK